MSVANSPEPSPASGGTFKAPPWTQERAWEEYERTVTRIIRDGERALAEWEEEKGGSRDGH